jgi:predicted RNA-binding protein with PIN domain
MTAASRWLIIDGYSLLHRDPELKPLLRGRLESARQLLVRKVERCLDGLAERATIVFDGKGERSERTLASLPQVEIVFAPRHLTADTVIERLVASATEPERIRVVTSDRAERQTVSAAGADSMSCGDFLDYFQRCTQAPGGRNGGGAQSTLGDFFPS